MNPWRSPIFWLHLFAGWLITMIFLSLLVGLFGSDFMTSAEGWTVGVAVQVLSIAAGYAFAKHHYKPPEQTGFDVIVKTPDDEQRNPTD